MRLYGYVGIYIIPCVPFAHKKWHPVCVSGAILFSQTIPICEICLFFLKTDFSSLLTHKLTINRKIVSPYAVVLFRLSDVHSGSV